MLELPETKQVIGFFVPEISASVADVYYWFNFDSLCGVIE